MYTIQLSYIDISKKTVLFLIRCKGDKSWFQHGTVLSIRFHWARPHLENQLLAILVGWANNAFFRQIRGKRAFSMAKLSTEYESGNENVLWWCFRSVNPQKSKWRPKMWNFHHRPPLNDPFVHLMFNFFCFQHRRVPIYLCIRCRGYYFFALCSLIASGVYFVYFLFVFDSMEHIHYSSRNWSCHSGQIFYNPSSYTSVM